MAHTDRTPTPAELERLKAETRAQSLDRAAKRLPQRGRKKGLGLTTRLDAIERMEREQ